MRERFVDWVEKRFPLRAVIRTTLDEDIPGGPSFFYSFGSIVLFLFIIQAATGVFQLFYYVPTVDHAYDSVSYLRTQVPFGWLVHGLHYWAAQLMVGIVVVHLAQVFIWGAFKNPRELTWFLGVFQLLCTLGMSFTGAALPWDVTGFWATEVGTSIAGTVPLVGDYIKQVIRGAESMGQLTLSRFFIVHIAILPGILALSVLLHLVTFRRSHSAGPWDPKKRTWTGPFWPDQLLKDTVFAVAVLVVLIGLTVWAAAPIAGPADPTDLSVQPKPEWDFLFLYQAIKAFKGPLEPVGTVLLPFAAVIFLFIVPGLSKKAERDPLKRPLGMAVFIAALAGVIVLTIAGALSRPGQGRGAAPPGTSPPAASARAAAPSQGSPQTPADAAEGERLFASEGCTGCHKVNGKGGNVGPDLSAEGSRGRASDWLAAQIRDPKSHNPGTVMPGYAARLKPAEIDSIVAYMLSLKGRAAAKPAGTKEAAPAGSPKAPPAAKEPAQGKGQTSAMQNEMERPSKPPAQEAAKPSEKPEAAKPEMNAAPGPVAKEGAAPAAAQKMPGPAAGTIGNAEHGAIVFAQTCQACHGPQGTGKVPNPGSTDGTVPPLNPIDREIFDADPKAFADKIDILIQHGSVPEGPRPSLTMPAWGDDHELTQQAIANVEAYVLSLNGVDRAKIMRPGMPPMLFFAVAAVCLVMTAAVLMIAGFPWRRKPPQ